MLLKFGPMILGRYAPRIFLMTTPCYDFNQLFTPPEDAPSQDGPRSSPIVREGGFLDPTGRTTRVFRHSDHKFEWTRDEFQSWCASQAEQWGYDVECRAIGRATDPDPWGRDVTPSGEPLRATFTAIFRRRADRHPAPATTRADSDPGPGPCAHHHELVLATAHPAHPSSHRPLPRAHIRAAVQERLLARRDGPAGEVYDLWADDAVARACGGALDALFAALDALVCETATRGEWAWDGAGRSRWRRRIVWHGYAARERELPAWQETVPVDEEDGPQEEDEGSVEDSPWENGEAGEQLDWESGVENNKPDLGWGDDWNRDIEGWGSPPPVRAELDGWGDWDEQKVGEIKLDAGGW